MQITVCAKCLETKCACEFYRARFPKEWAERDKLGCAPFVKAEGFIGSNSDRTHAGKDGSGCLN